MFEKHKIWERTEDYTVVYVLFRDLDTDLYHVQQANFVTRGSSKNDIAEALATHSYYLLDAFGEKLPSETSPGFPTIKEAVKAHKCEFAEMAPPRRS